jgi:F-type H+-transporting ATPase subunit delta
MSDYNITTRYANALIELAEEKKSFEQVSSDIELVHNTLKSSKELRIMLTSPIIKQHQKSSILENIFVSKIGNDTRNFLRFMIDKNREDYLYKIVKRYLELKDLKLGIVNIIVTSVIELSENQKKELNKKLEAYTNKKVRINFKTDDTIVGGFIIRIGDSIIDASVVHQLDLLKNKFLDESSIEN